MKVIGLTGGIGCGKSTAAAFFQQQGIPCVDADAICRALTAGSGTPILARIAASLGPEMLKADGSFDRKAAADRVFDDHAALKTLEAILLDEAKTRAKIELGRLADAGEKLAVLDAPLLFEAQWNDLTDITVCVWAPPALQNARLQSGRGWNENEIARRRARQMNEEEKLERCDYGLINNGGLDALHRQCSELLNQITTYNL